MPIINEKQVRAATEHNIKLSDEQVKQCKRKIMSLEEIQAEIERIADLPLEQATTLPADAFISEDYFDWEMEHLFRNDWVCLAHTSQIPENGDFLNIDFLGEPMIVVRDKSDKVQVMSRVCPHRGMDIMPPGFGHDGHGPAEAREGGKEQGHTRLFLCPYHSWTFDLDGKLKACPEMQQAECFERGEWELKKYRFEVWNGFIFVNLDSEAEFTVAEKYADMEHALENWNLDDLVMAHHSHWEIPCNWKVLAENFMESYHHLGTHVKTLQTIMPAKGTYNDAEHPHFMRAHLPYGNKACAEMHEADEAGDQWEAFPPIQTLTDEQRRKWELFMGYPLFTLVPAPEQIVWYRIEPVAPNRLRLMTSALVPKSTKDDPKFKEWIKRGEEEAVWFHLEDMEVLSAVQRGFYSSGNQRGRLSHLEMSVWQLQRYRAARARGTYPTLDRPAAPAQK